MKTTKLSETDWWTDANILDWAMIRPNTTTSNRVAAARYAQGKADSIAPPIAYNVDFLDKTRDDGFYCSQLPWLAYKLLGIDLETNVGAMSNFPYLRDAVTPDDLYYSVSIGKSALIQEKQIDANTRLQRAIFRIFSPADMVLVDAQGRRAGYDPRTGTGYSEIPGVTYSGPSSEPETLTVSNLVGNWTLNVYGTGTGTYTLDEEQVIAEAPTNQSVVKPASPGNVDTFQVNSAGIAPQLASLNLSITGDSRGDANVVLAPLGPSYAPGTVVTLTATPTMTPTYIPGAVDIFVGWVVDGQFQGWANPLTITMNTNHAITAMYAYSPMFPDETYGGGEMNVAIRELAARGIIHGYQDGRFGLNDHTLRAQMAALIARAMGWDSEDHGNSFPDQGSVDNDLWRNVGTLNYYNVARGYQDGTYGPIDDVLNAQVISFITRGMVAKGYWQYQPDDPSLYPNVPIESGHRQDLATYTHYVGALTSGNWYTWNEPSWRGLFALLQWRALDSYFGVDNVP